LASLTGADLRKPLGVDRAFHQSAITHDVDFAHRRITFGKYLDDGAFAGVEPWKRSGIPFAGYCFMRPRDGGGDDPVEQADVTYRRAMLLGCTGIMLDVEYDRTTGGTVSPAEVQAAIDYLNGRPKPLPLIGYWSQNVAPPHALRGLLGVMIANYSFRPRIDVSAGTRVVAWQFTSRPWDRAVWLHGPSYETYFQHKWEPITVPPLPDLGISSKEHHPMFDPVPTTLHRVVDLRIGTVFREWPSTDPGSRQGIVTTDGEHPEAPTRPFGYVGKVMGIPGWTLVKNGARYVYVRTSDVVGVRTADVEVIA
jgi:hypothetical protein